MMMRKKNRINLLTFPIRIPIECRHCNPYFSNHCKLCNHQYQNKWFQLLNCQRTWINLCP